jgi:hypothetical protein
VIVDGPVAALAVSAVGGEATEWVGIAVREAALTRQQTSFLRHYAMSDSVIVALGGDSVRRRASVELLPLLEQEFSNVFWAELPEDRNPKVLHVAANDPFDLRAELMNPRPLAGLAIDLELSARSRNLDHMAGRLGAMRSVAKFVLRLPTDSIADELSRLSDRLRLDPATVTREVLRASTTRSMSRNLGSIDGTREVVQPAPEGPGF